MNTVSVVFTSCGRFDLLKKTIDSFLDMNTYPIEKYIVIDNSTLENAHDEIESILENIDNKLIIVNETNIGQVASIDKAYGFVESDYIFHCEDDWEFFKESFIEKSMDVLNGRPDVYNINLRVRFDNEKGSLHPISDKMETKNGTIYCEYIYGYFGVWHGFSWNPGLRRLSDYNQIKPYKRYHNEQGMNKVMRQLNMKGTCLEHPHCKHIGTNSKTYKSNE